MASRPSLLKLPTYCVRTMTVRSAGTLCSVPSRCVAHRVARNTLQIDRKTCSLLGNASLQRGLTTVSSEVTETDEPDVLYRAVDVYIKGHEDSVLESYSQFATMAADELGIKVAGILKPKMILDRVTLLRSVFIYKKHRIQYEAQTHKRVIQLKHLTGSTADAYLSYLQLNIPAGVAMEVHKWAIESLPKHLEEAMEKNLDRITEEDEAVAEKMRAKMKEPKGRTNLDYEEYPTTKPYLIGTHG